MKIVQLFVATNRNIEAFIRKEFNIKSCRNTIANNILHSKQNFHPQYLKNNQQNFHKIKTNDYTRGSGKYGYSKSKSHINSYKNRTKSISNYGNSLSLFIYFLISTFVRMHSDATIFVMTKPFLTFVKSCFVSQQRTRNVGNISVESKPCDGK